ncbi:MAG: threonine/serine dehydratase [Rhodospirillaceae bacterium]|nr:threonine/serine dehydratase [Rhodospirillaceae bacterium]
MLDTLPNATDVRSAALRIEGKAYKTPLLEVPLLNERLGFRLLVKPETLQRTGSFKFRGAYNRISRIPEDQQKGGVVAFSSGNHAQGVAAAAQMLGLPALIVMPSDAPAIKVANTRSYGAEIVFYDRFGEDREAIAEKLVAERKATLVRPFDDPMIIAGQGTVGLEIAQQARALDITLDAVLSPCGGGGLVGGSALALASESPQTEVYAVEPDGFDDTARSMVAGERLSIEPGATSICDALLSPEPGNLTLQINARLLAGGLSVSDDAVTQAMQIAFKYLKLVVEPGGAVALAALLSGQYDGHGKTVGIILSGGNVDQEVYRKALEA